MMGQLVGVRLQPHQIKAIDAWAAKQQPPVTRPEAIRGMVDAMLRVFENDPGEGPTRKARPKQATPARAERAKELAARAIDKIGDPAVHPAEHAQRRHRLTKGPEEFREVRVDRPKAKK